MAWGHRLLCNDGRHCFWDNHWNCGPCGQLKHVDRLDWGLCVPGRSVPDDKLPDGVDACNRILEHKKETSYAVWPSSCWVKLALCRAIGCVFNIIFLMIWFITIWVYIDGYLYFCVLWFIVLFVSVVSWGIISLVLIVIAICPVLSCLCVTVGIVIVVQFVFLLFTFFILVTAPYQFLPVLPVLGR